MIEEVRAGEETVKAAVAFFSAQEIVEIIVTCGYYMTLARITETTRVDVEPAGGSAVLEELGGYAEGVRKTKRFDVVKLKTRPTIVPAAIATSGLPSGGRTKVTSAK